MSRKVLAGTLVTLTALVAFLFSAAPSALVNHATVPHIKGDLDGWLADNERKVDASRAIIPGAEKHIHWFQDRANTKTAWSVVYFHGFSATRQEIAPVPEQVADALQANLFETRLRGHGLLSNALTGVRAEDWLEDAAEALSIGAAIGDRIVLIGVSNGATLAMAMAGHPTFGPVSTLILLSPNFGPSDPNAELLTSPGGPQLAHLVVGETRTWKPHNELQARYWTTSYPVDALVEVMRLVDYVRGQLPMQLSPSLLMFYSPADTVVDPTRITAAFNQISSQYKLLVAIPGSTDPGNHVLAGNIMSPGNNRFFVDCMAAFARSGEADVGPRACVPAAASGNLVSRP